MEQHMKLPPQTRQRPKHIKDYSYDAEAQTLTVTFHNGKRYRYDGVSSQLADGFQGSGSYLRQHVAPQCSYKCLDGNHDHD
jgi:hypothetical protein